MIGAVGCLLAASAVEVATGMPAAAVPGPIPNAHVQVQGNPACRANSTSELWKLYDLPIATVGAFQIANAVNQEMFVTGIDGNVYHDYVDPATGKDVGWTSLGGPASGIFGAVHSGTNYLGNQELYVHSLDGQVYHLFATPGSGSGWHGWDPMGAPTAGIHFGSDVYEETNYLGNQELYVFGGDGDVYHKFATPGVGTGWSEWDSMSHPSGVAIRDDVQVGTNYRCNQEVFVTGTDGNTYHKFATPGQGTGWSDWGTLGKPATGVSGAVKAGENAADNQELFIIDGRGTVFHNYATPGLGTGWAGWTSLGAPPGTMISSTVIVDTLPAQILTVVTSAGSFVKRATPGDGGGWSDWTPGSGASPTA